MEENEVEIKRVEERIEAAQKCVDAEKQKLEEWDVKVQASKDENEALSTQKDKADQELKEAKDDLDENKARLDNLKVFLATNHIETRTIAPNSRMKLGNAKRIFG